MIYQILFKPNFYAEARHNLKQITNMLIRVAKLGKQGALQNC